MMNANCLICFKAYSCIIDIMKTNLQVFFEKLTDLKVQYGAQYLCLICVKRLQQCYQLQQLAINQFKKKIGIYNDDDEVQNKNDYLMSMSISIMLNVTIPRKSEIFTETPKFKKEEKAEDEYALKVDIEQDSLDYFKETEITIKDEFSHYVSSHLKNINITQVTQIQTINKIPKITNIEKKEVDSNNTSDPCIDSITKYTCDICQYVGNSEISINNHLRLHSKCKTYVKRNQAKVKSHKLLVNCKKTYTCDICKIMFFKKYKLIAHIKIHTYNKPCDYDVCKKIINTNEKSYCCDVCNKTFYRKDYLVNHLRKHTGNKPYACNVCNKKFAQSSTLNKHKITHSSFKPYFCDVCNKTFSQNGNLIRHKRTHTGVKPYICNLCKKTFSDVSTLNRHKKIHIGLKPYVCCVCNKTFIYNTHLIRHKRIHKVFKHL